MRAHRTLVPAVFGAALLLAMSFQFSPAIAQPNPIFIVNQVCVTSGGYLYCIGGENASNGSGTGTVEYAPLSSSGIGTWKITTSYPLVPSKDCFAYSGYVYCIGGGTPDGNASSNSYYATLSSSGVGEWKSTTGYPAAVAQSGPSCTVSSGLIYCLGGSSTVTGTSASNLAYYAALSDSGIGQWRSTTGYPIAMGDGSSCSIQNGIVGCNLGGPSCVASSGYMYCVGGDECYSAGSRVICTVTPDAYFAETGSTGISSLGWTNTTAYPDATGPSCLAFSSDIFCVGQGTYYSYTTGSGIGAWSNTAVYPGGYVPSCGIYSGDLYCVSIYDNLEFYAPISSNGLGAWSTEPYNAAQTGPTGTSTGSSSYVATSTITSFSQGTNIPPPTGCTTPGDTASASLITKLGTNATKGLSLSHAPASVLPYEVLFFGGLVTAGALALTGIAWAIYGGVRRAARRNQSPQELMRKSHRARNAYLAIFLIVIVAIGAGYYGVMPYLGGNKGTAADGELQNIVGPGSQIDLAPHGITYFYVQAYANDQTTLLEGNFTVTLGSDVQVVIIPDSLLSHWGGDLRNGTFAGGVFGCTMAGIPVLYNSGLVSSGSFAVAIPVASNITQYDLIFANPSPNQTTVGTANVYYGY